MKLELYTLTIIDNEGCHDMMEFETIDEATAYYLENQKNIYHATIFPKNTGIILK